MTVQAALSFFLLATSAPASAEPSRPTFATAPLVFALEPSAQDAPDDVASDSVAQTPAAIRQFGIEGSWRWSARGSFATDVKDSENQLRLIGGGAEYFMADGVSLNLELNAIRIDQVGRDANAINFNLLLRWHFVNEPTYSLYIDGGAGMLGSSAHVPADGSSFNFTPQAGAGATISLHEDIRLMGGVRWHHISNANTFESNPGRDSVEVYLGVSVGF